MAAFVRTSAVRLRGGVVPELFGGDLLKLTIHEHGGRMVLRLEGKLIGPWTAVVERCWQDTLERTAKLVVVDLKAVTFIDESGKALLADMHDRGAALEASGPLTAYIVEKIRTGAMAGTMR